jgi:hypothetical protein
MSKLVLALQVGSSEKSKSEGKIMDQSDGPGNAPLTNPASTKGPEKALATGTSSEDKTTGEPCAPAKSSKGKKKGTHGYWTSPKLAEEIKVKEVKRLWEKRLELRKQKGLLTQEIKCIKKKHSRTMKQASKLTDAELEEVVRIRKMTRE